MDILKKAVLSPMTDENGTNLTVDQRHERQIVVDFNPETLDITLTNNLKKGRGKKPVQTVTDATAQLSAELIFDTTTSGVDVRSHTSLIAALMNPVERAGKRKPKEVPAIVLFEWGTVTFTGYIDSYKEKLDFFSRDGVPLRATVSLSITQQERNFEPGEDDEDDLAKRVTGSPVFGGDATGAPTPPNSPIDASAGGVDPGTAAALAAANGIENPRFPEVDQIALPDLSELGQPPVAFASGELSAGAGLGAGAGLDLGVGAGAGLDFGAGAGLGLGAGAGLDASAGLGLDAGAGFSASAGAGFSAEAGAGAGFSASASGVSGTAAAFSGLNKSVSRSFGSSRSSVAKLETFAGGLAAGGSAGISLDAGAGVQLGGQAFASAGASLNAGVSATASASAGASADAEARVQAQISFLED